MSTAVKCSVEPGSPHFASAAQLVQMYLVVCSVTVAGMMPAIVHAGYTKELTVKTITVSVVKFTPKLVFKP